MMDTLLRVLLQYDQIKALIKVLLRQYNVLHPLTRFELLLVAIENKNIG